VNCCASGDRSAAKSQLDLSMDTGISQRHLSFVESGRRAPSRHFLSVVSDALNIPLRERNYLLLASGFAPQYNEQRIDAAQMEIVSRAIDRMLQQHEPHPALVQDRHWFVVRTNSATPRLFGSFIDLEKWPKPRNLLNLMFDPAGLRPFVEDWETVAAGLLQRVRREAVGQCWMQTAGAAEAATGVSRCCQAETIACATKSGDTFSVS
jgi:transcriptional regulator with XRE-family HTH domain